MVLKNGARNRLVLDEQVGEHIVALAVGNDDSDTCVIHFLSNVVFRFHSSATCIRLLALNKMAEVVARLHVSNQF